ncbi:MAG: SHOCT domain-containing protein [Anaerolineae bacterium]|nr:SHOCT domain-containing protein [Anaerolineae bacterium]NIO70588.1 SHOCT domain-containing protein [Anaerolineae bacterium]
MGPEFFWWGGMWWIFPIIFIGICVVFFMLRMFGRGRFGPPWQDSSRYSSESRESETALEILKKRYAKGEITKEEFDQMKKDL